MAKRSRVIIAWGTRGLCLVFCQSLRSLTYTQDSGYKIQATPRKAYIKSLTLRSDIELLCSKIFFLALKTCISALWSGTSGFVIIAFLIGVGPCHHHSSNCQTACYWMRQPRYLVPCKSRMWSVQTFPEPNSWLKTTWVDDGRCINAKC